MVVVPLAMAVTTPIDDIVAALVLVLLHTPPPVPLALNADVEPGQRLVVPLMVPAAGNGLIVTMAVAATGPQTLVTV